MLTEIYIEALLADQELADLVWEAWDCRALSDETVTQAWMFIMGNSSPLTGNGSVFTTRRWKLTARI